MIQADWPAPPHVRVVSTTRPGGVSVGAYASFNLAAHVGDEPAHVERNRRALRAAAGLPAEPLWLEQVHGTAVARHGPAGAVPRADAAVSFEQSEVCAVMTADCLPVVFTDRVGSCVAVAHAGWRGLQAGVLEATFTALTARPEDVLAWLGPAIGPGAFEVGAEVRAAFVGRLPGSDAHFQFNAAGRYQADLYALARLALAGAGVTAVYGGGWCTASAPETFFSFRRDGVTGRMATLAWLS
ncbi:MAG: peptidoglycan editing factor PgeF [Lysobacterales bacterium]|nr:MAG: peptidoglycan editing factor PgeF [Xanthomonadales bacterium]